MELGTYILTKKPIKPSERFQPFISKLNGSQATNILRRGELVVLTVR